MRVLHLLKCMETLLLLLAHCQHIPAIDAAAPDYHSLNYYFTTILPPAPPGRPYYHVGGSINDVHITRYTSDLQKVQPLLSCLEECMDPQHWENQTHIAKYYEKRHQQTINYMKRNILLNQEKGHRATYVFQVKFWCVLSGDDSVSGYEEFAANGDHFISLDTFYLEFVPLMSAAETLTQDWNRRHFGPKRQKSYMEQECIMWLKQYMECACVTERLQPVRPQVKVSSHQSEGVTQVHCLVYGFYPRAVVVKWMRNRREMKLSDEVNKVLPNPDGTYQTRVTVTMEEPAGEEDSYSCYVDHSSLEETLYVAWELKTPKTSGRSWHIGIVAAICVFLLITLYVVRRRNANHAQKKFWTLLR